MHRTPATLEENLISKALKEECTWENLPKRLHSTFSSREEWHRRVIEHCIKKRLLWSTCFARRVIRESDYYEEMMRYLRKNFALFPYHLAEYVCRVMRVSPFRYYCDMIFEVMKNEQPYDSIPNFSAADALRITGVGRNEFIDIMNKSKSKKLMWKLNKSIAKELLPTLPVDFPIETWWGVCLVNFTVEEFKKLSEEEIATIDKVCKEEANSYAIFDPYVIKGLHRRGLVYFDVIVYPDDRFKVSRLEGFVSNKDQSYEDPIEELLYAVFVVSSENATVAELAATLQADLLLLQAAASLACRLGWAVKIIDPASVLQDSTAHGSLTLSDDEDISRGLFSGRMTPDGFSAQHDTSGPESRVASNHARVAFIVDANITSYLMMGSVSPGLKSHAVTLYEAGKLGHASIADLCKDLSTLDGAKFEGELQEFADHSSSLRSVLECLLVGGVATCVRDAEIYHHKTGAFVGIGEVDNFQKMGDSSLSQKNDATSLAVETDLNDDDNGVPDGHVLSADTKSVNDDHGNDVSAAISPNGFHESREDEKLKPRPQNSEKSKQNTSSDLGKSAARKNKNYRVDILRSESLASLPPATLDRLFRRDYDVVISMIPLPPTSVLPGPTGRAHFGPPSHSSMTPWMNLVLYSSVGIGPLSVVLMKGQYLRLLPAPLAGCEKALIWSWDGSAFGGLGGKREGNLVTGTILLHCLNSLLKHSAVLVLPLSKNDLDQSGRIVTIDLPLPLKNSDGLVMHVGEELGLGMEESMRLDSVLRVIVDKIDLWTIGYIRLLRLFLERDSNFPTDEKYEWVPLSVEFGVPLFNPDLCKSMCKRMVLSQLLQTESFDEHHEAMQGLRRRLRDICAEYNATGPAAKLLYQKDKCNTSQKLMSYASGKWNPLLEPSSPISSPSDEYQRRKLAVRQRSRREILSFDGSLLRSYALNPMFESGSRPIEESGHNASKTESDDGDSKEVILPGVSLLFDGEQLEPFDLGACLQAHQPISLIAVASSATSSLVVK